MRGCSGCINFFKFKRHPQGGGMCDVYDWNVSADSKPKDCKYFSPIPYNRTQEKMVVTQHVLYENDSN